jgi:membrane protein
MAPWVALGVMLAIWPRGNGQSTALLAGLEPGRGRRADSPGEIPAAGWKDILWRTWSEARKDRIPAVAAGVTFFTILALFPGVTAFVSLYGMFADVDTAQRHLTALAGVVPSDALTMIGDQMIRIAATRQASLSVTFAVSLVLSVWSANAGVKALFAGLNVAYEQDETRSFLKLNLVSLVFTFASLAFLLVAMSAMVALPLALNILHVDPASRLLAVLRWPALLAVMMLGLAAVYRFGPDREHPRWRWVTWGGAAAAVSWMAMSLLFSWYVANFARYNAAYGPLSAIVVFMIWIWLSVTVILAGAELNAESEHQTIEDSTTGAPLPMGLRGARMADSLGASRPGEDRKMAESWFRRILRPPARPA